MVYYVYLLFKKLTRLVRANRHQLFRIYHITLLIFRFMYRKGSLLHLFFNQYEIKCNFFFISGVYRRLNGYLNKNRDVTHIQLQTS